MQFQDGIQYHLSLPLAPQIHKLLSSKSTPLSHTPGNQYTLVAIKTLLISCWESNRCEGWTFRWIQVTSFENRSCATGAFPIADCKFWPLRIITLYQYHWRTLKVIRFVCGRARGQIYCVFRNSALYHGCGNIGLYVMVLCDESALPWACPSHLLRISG